MFDNIDFQQIQQQNYSMNQMIVANNVNDIVIVVEGCVSI